MNFLRAKVSFQNKCNLLEATILEKEKEQDKVILECTTFKGKQNKKYVPACRSIGNIWLERKAK